MDFGMENWKGSGGSVNKCSSNFKHLLMCSHDARGKMGDAMEQCEVSDLFVESRVRGVGTENFPN